MPSGKNWVKFLYVNLVFVIYIAGVLYYNQVAEIKANWPLYRKSRKIYKCRKRIRRISLPINMH